MKDQLGDRMKQFYEDRTRFMLPRRTYTVIRIDGKAFHTYTRGLIRPFDSGLIEDMNQTTAYLCQNIQGCKMGYVQSDEISLVLTDFDKLTTSAWFDGNIQKQASIAASMTTAKFNQLRYARNPEQMDKMAMFDARVFSIPFVEEVVNYLIWRQQDATRNSISSVAQSLYPHKALMGKSSDQKQELIFQKGINWNNFSAREKRGGLIRKVKVSGVSEQFNATFERNKWMAVETPIFTQDKQAIIDLIEPK